LATVILIAKRVHIVKDIGIGVIGLGMGHNVLAIDEDPTSRLSVRVICDTDPTTLARVQAQRPDIALATDDYRRLIDQSDVDVVAIYSPDHLHFQHIRDALLAGKHVICTKPMVVSLMEAREVVRLVDRTGCKVLVGQTCRFVPRFMAAKKLYDDGDLGRPLFAEAHYAHDMRPVLNRTPWRYEAPQDLMYGGACHPIDLLRWFFGDVDEVFCYAGKSDLDPRYGVHGLHDNFLINLRFANGVIARVLAVFGLVEPPMPMLGLGIFGTKGSFVNDRLVFDKLEGKPEFQLRFPAEAGHGTEVLRYLRHFEECLLEDRQPLVNEREGARCIATCAAAWESVRTGQPAKVDNAF
jgi:predicted dehydrogenase